eukprot:scaffold51699_cov39-Prasinocladus_malaysianus.AAC.1
MKRNKLPQRVRQCGEWRVISITNSPHPALTRTTSSGFGYSLQELVLVQRIHMTSQGTTCYRYMVLCVINNKEGMPWYREYLVDTVLVRYLYPEKAVKAKLEVTATIIVPTRTTSDSPCFRSRSPPDASTRTGTLGTLWSAAPVTRHNVTWHSTNTRTRRLRKCERSLCQSFGCDGYA